MAEYNRTRRQFSFIFNLSWLVTVSIIGGVFKTITIISTATLCHSSHAPSHILSASLSHKHTHCHLPYWLSLLAVWAYSSTGLCNNASPGESSRYSIRFSSVFFKTPIMFQVDIWFYSWFFFHFTTSKVGKKLTQTIPSRAWLGAGI